MGPPNRIYEVEIDLVRTCNLQCKMCNFWKNSVNPERSSTEELKKAILNLHNWFQRDFKIAFAGGEPFMRKDAVELIEYSSNLGITTTVITNGTLMTEKMIDEIVESGLVGLTISIDSLDPKKHDYIRGVKGTFEKAFGTFNKIIEKKKGELPYLSIASIVSNYNHLDVIKILKWLKENKAGFLVIQCLSYNFFPHTEGWFDKKLWPSSKEEALEICDSLRTLINMKEEGYPLINDAGQINEMINYFNELDWKGLIQNG